MKTLINKKTGKKYIIVEVNHKEQTFTVSDIQSKEIAMCDGDYEIEELIDSNVLEKLETILFTELSLASTFEADLILNALTKAYLAGVRDSNHIEK